MGSRRKDRELHWRRVLKQQAKSGLNVAIFCRQESVSVPSFYAWRRKLADRTAEGKRAAKASLAISANRADTSLVPVRIESTESPAPVRILLPHGIAIDAPSNIAPSALRSLLGALREVYRC